MVNTTTANPNQWEMKLGEDNSVTENTSSNDKQYKSFYEELLDMEVGDVIELDSNKNYDVAVCRTIGGWLYEYYTTESFLYAVFVPEIGKKCCKSTLLNG